MHVCYVVDVTHSAECCVVQILSSDLSLHCAICKQPVSSAVDTPCQHCVLCPACATASLTCPVCNPPAHKDHSQTDCLTLSPWSISMIPRLTETLVVRLSDRWSVILRCDLLVHGTADRLLAACRSLQKFLSLSVGRCQNISRHQRRKNEDKRLRGFCLFLSPTESRCVWVS